MTDNNPMTDAERLTWDRLVAERTTLRKDVQEVEDQLKGVLGAVFTRALQRGHWGLTEVGTGYFRVTPSDVVTEKVLTHLGRVSLSLGWHDSLVIEGGGTALLVDFDDGDVTLELMARDPAGADAFRRALNVDIDLGAWAAGHRARAVEEIDKKIAALQEQRKAYDVG